MELSNNKILITGGATGIGLGLAERFIAQNNNVIICGRRDSVLKEATGKFPSLITYRGVSMKEVRGSFFLYILML